MSPTTEPLCHTATGKPGGTHSHELFIVATIGLMVCWILQHTGADLWVADRLFLWQGKHWAARNAWWATDVLHSGARKLAIFCWIVLLLAWLASSRSRLPAQWRGSLGYLVSTLPVSNVVLGMLKRFSGVDCPWDLLRYGGTREFLPIFSGQASGDPPGACFPAAHAGIGYAWVALWFALHGARPAWRYTAMGMALALGALFGVTQQLRGAHFLSHDLCSLTLCWLVAALMARLWSGRTGRNPAAGGTAAESAR
ncbi:phosphatase PAP2 family protein [Xanthomonadaceae bacterium JHOS43]|nr:phosphatase PAP2 family protein [Xanthomonadaceae bacterium JHOS43]MCX7562670.1 phosphatase PAP2 family protein [Xanthomonadaceae bacterium XH05]